MPNLGALALVFLSSTLASGGLIWLLQPLWRHYALAKPNRRSSHKEPTPQGGGIAVIAVTIVVTALAAVFIAEMYGATPHIALVLAAAVLLAIVGAIDDVYVIEVVPRFFLQTLAVIIVVAALPPEARIFQVLPWWIERLLLLFGGIWFVNLVNFMDGIDWMTVAEVVPVTAGLAIFGLMGALPLPATIVALALCGATLGFAPFNRPVARLFLGDVGSLPIGLLLTWLLIQLAARGHLAAALLLPLYYTADATVTLLRRLVSGERITQAHRDHYYQRALDRGSEVGKIVAAVAGTNVVLMGLAALTLVTVSIWVHVALAAAGSGIVAALLWVFNRGRR